MQQHLLLPLVVITVCINAIPVFDVPFERCVNKDRNIPLYRKEFACIQSVPSAILYWSNPTAAGSFPLLNINVQNPSPDPGTGIRLKQLSCKWRNGNDSLFVVSGEVLKKCIIKISPKNTSIPEYFFRIGLTCCDSALTADVLFTPQLKSNDRQQQYAVSIASIKEIKAIDLFEVFLGSEDSKPEGTLFFYTWL